MSKLFEVCKATYVNGRGGSGEYSPGNVVFGFTSKDHKFICHNTVLYGLITKEEFLYLHQSEFDEYVMEIEEEYFDETEEVQQTMPNTDSILALYHVLRNITRNIDFVEFTGCDSCNFNKEHKWNYIQVTENQMEDAIQKYTELERLLDSISVI